MASTTSNALAQAGITVPKISFNTGDWIYYLIGGIILAGVIIAGVYLLIQRLAFNKRIRLFRTVGNKAVPVGSDMAKFERIGIGGDYWCRTKRFKKIIPRPKIEMGKNEYWFYEREDGEWINFGLENIDIAMKEAGAYFVDEDMRLQRLGIQRNLSDRFDKPGFWQKYGGIIVYAFFIIIITISLIVILKEIKGLVEALPQLANALESVANAMRDSAIRSGSGLIPANASGVPL